MRNCVTWIFALVLGLFCVCSVQAETNESVSYCYPVYNTSGVPSSGIKTWQTNTVNATVISGSTTSWGSSKSSTYYYVVNKDTTIGGSGGYVTCEGQIWLILKPGVTLTITSGTDNTAAIRVLSSNATLTICGTPDGAGTLIATGSGTAAGIGGNGSAYNASGSITINGGTVKAYGGEDAAGIGGGYYLKEGTGGNGQKVTINGGTVTAEGGLRGAGIGGARKAIGSDIAINGGTVNARGGNYASGIGGGNYGAGSNITINGGHVTAIGPAASGNNAGAGIGGGYNGSGSNITINGGTVEATGYNGGAGIGGGYRRDGSNGTGTNIKITAGTVTARAAMNDGENYSGGAGIGGGGSATGSDITISGGIVTAYGVGNGAGIGGGTDSAGSGITISGGTVKAYGGPANKTDTLGGAGIGGGGKRNTASGGTGSSIVITGGTVYVSGTDGDLIGNGGGCTAAASGNGVTASATVFFNLAGLDAALPSRVSDYTIMTPVTAEDRTLVGGASAWTAADNFVLKNAGTGATGSITVNAAESVSFANKNLKLQFGGSALKLVTTSAPFQYRMAVYNTPGNPADGIASWVTNYVDAYTVVTSDMTTLEEGWYVVNADVTISDRITCNGNIHLILADGATLLAPAGMTVADPSSLTIYGQLYDSGALTIDHVADNSAAIGCSGGATVAGPVTIHGGRVSATAGAGGAGIGGGRSNNVGGSGNHITINGGTVTVMGKGNGAGIGGGGGVNGAGTGSYITINGGTVTATGYNENGMAGGAGIGGGGGFGGSAEHITINGGVVTATGYNNSAGIGGGKNASASDIVIRGGTIIASSIQSPGSDWAGGAGIGGGLDGTGSGIQISGGTVTASSSGSGAGIGGGANGAGTDITISAGLVTAHGGLSNTAASLGGAAIGGGGIREAGNTGGTGSNIQIVGGTVYVSGQDAELIGKGGGCATAASGNSVSGESKVFFNLASRDMPADFTAFAIMTPDPAEERTLVGGIPNWTAAESLALTNAATAATSTIDVNNAVSVAFANRYLDLPNTNSLLRLAFGILLNPIVKDVNGNDVTIEIPREWRTQYDLANETVTNVTQTLENGLPAWQSYVLGKDPHDAHDVIYADAPQNASASTVTVVAMNVDTGAVIEGYSIASRLANGPISPAPQQAGVQVGLPLTGADPSGSYRLKVVIFKNVDTEIAQTADAINTFGILGQVQAGTKAVITVPWGLLGRNGDQPITVSNLVKTASLNQGDKLHAYAGGVYNSWELGEDHTWKPVTTVKVGEAGNGTLHTSPIANVVTVARGTGFWLERANTSTPYYLYGQVQTNAATTVLMGGTKTSPTWNLIGSPGVTNLDLNAQFGSGSSDDKIMVPTGYAPKNYTYKNGQWGYNVTVPVYSPTNETQQIGVRMQRKTDDTEVPPGTGFWYINYSGEKNVEWK